MKRPLLVILLFVLGMVTIFAGTTGTIMGFVLDKDTGVPVESAKVTVVETGLSTGTDSSGLFLVAGLAVGQYSLLVEKLGYQSVSIQDIYVSLDQTTTLSVELKSSPVEIKNPIIVTASRLLVNKDQIGAVTKIDHSMIIDMSSRDIFRAAQIAPGVVTNEDGQMKIRGTRESNTTFLLDGLSIMDPFHNTFGSVINAKSIMGEVDVITGSFDAEYGNALGGVINTVSATPETKKYKVMASVNTAKAIPDLFGDVERYRKLGEEEYNWDIEGPAPFIFKDKLGFIFTGQVFLANCSTHSGYQNDKYEEFHDYHLKLDYKISPTDRLSYHTQYGFAWIRLSHRYADLTGWPVQHQSNRFHHLLYNRSITSDTYFKLALSWFNSGIDYGAHAIDNSSGEPVDLINDVKPIDEIGEGDFWAHQRSRSVNSEIRFDLSSDHYTGHKIKGGFDIQRIHTDLLWAVFLLDPWYLDQAWFNAGYPFPVYWYLENHIHEYYQTNG
ncbi:TonB-dependent receptor, partial [bacterium]|nr:TonB-dependent receptor [bacterium]